jgi:hypothetical protein
LGDAIVGKVTTVVADGTGCSIEVGGGVKVGRVKEVGVMIVEAGIAEEVG